jgi:hypothetical protein
MIEFALTAWSFIRGALPKLWTWARKPPGLYVVIALAAILALWWFGHREYRAGQATCEAAHAATAAKIVAAQERRNTAAVAASESRTTADTKIEYRNKEIIRYVTRQATTLPDGGDTCLSADLADRVRDLQ